MYNIILIRVYQLQGNHIDSEKVVHYLHDKIKCTIKLIVHLNYFI